MALFDWLKRKFARVNSPTIKLFVDNLAKNVKAKHLRRLFERYGTVVNVQVATHPTLNMPLGYGYVEMTDGMEAAIKYLNGATFEGRLLTVTKFEAKQRGLISPSEFHKQLIEYQRPVREMIVTPGDPGCEPITKISGIPWWPSNQPRPYCDYGHAMSFMAQVRLSDVPTFESYRDSLISFHYCQECSYEGRMAFGWNDTLDDKKRYDVAIIDNIKEKQPDCLGAIAEVVIEPQSVKFRDTMEAPGYEETLLNLSSIPDDYPQGLDDFDENIYPGVIHIAKRKVGGWPTWVQHPKPPETAAHEKLHFLGQLDGWLCDQSSWCTGYAYLFLISSEDQILRGELSIQTT